MSPTQPYDSAPRISSEPAADAPAFLAGGGEMGVRMRATNWTPTALGDISLWPESLRSALSICLGARFPIALYWGPQLALLYNDAWSPILGSKHPWALARPGIEVWPEIWDTIGPLFEKVLKTGEATYSENQLLPMYRHGYTEECYFNFTFSPIRGQGAEVAGIFNAVLESTAQVIAARRTDALRDLGAALVGVQSVDDACKLAVNSLATAPRDVSFAAVYLTQSSGDSARLVATGNLSPTSIPEAITLDEPGAPLPLLRVHETSVAEVGDLGSRFDTPLPGGAWPEPTRSALIAPLVVNGQISGFLVLGASPRRAVDEEYRQFAARAATLVATAIATATAYESAQKRAEELAALDRAKTTFFSNVSHELRTPLTLMLGPTEDALAAGQPLGGEELRAVHRNELRLLKLVNALLDFSRMEAGRTQASFVPTDLAALTSDLASTFRSAIERAGLRLRLECSPLGEPIYVDRSMWEKVVFNLLSNALKFTLAGEIAVELRETTEGAELKVRDTGTGIPAAELPRMFERFHRIEGQQGRTHEGSGIGLALANEIVRLHGGSVSVDSTVGKGSTFTVALKRGTAHLPPDRIGATSSLDSTALGADAYIEEAMRWLATGETASAATTPVLAPPLADKTEGARIIVADDNADMRDYVGRLLGQRWRVETVPNGTAALEAARRQRPDLILSDVMMPVLDGFGLVREIRRDDGLRSVPIVLLSARAGEESRVEGLEAGADDYLPKPFSARELVARVATHLQLARLRQAVERERDTLKHLFVEAPVIINFLRGPDLVYDVVHPSISVALDGRHPLGRSLLDVHPELRDQPFCAQLHHVLRTGEVIQGREALARFQRHGVLEDTYWDYSFIPVRNVDGEVEGVMTCSVEVTDQVEARRLLDAARRQAEDASRAKDEFLAMLGHELRNPLAPIQTALQLMRLRGATAVERERSVIERQVRHLVRLVDDLLDVSRITRGKVELTRTHVDVAGVIARAIEMASPLLEQRRHHVTADVPLNSFVDGDPDRLAQVFSNLVTNAAKYTPERGQIAIHGRREGDSVIVDVKDNGVGISPELLPRVFDLFVQGRQGMDRAQGGLGLGLAIVRRLVEMHGGNVSVASGGAGKGTTFTVQLRAISVSESEMQPATAPRPPSTIVPADRGNILVVDDNEDAAELLSEALQTLGFVTRVAHDGPSALALVREFRPNVALLDIGLPVMDGYELARRLREFPELRDIRMIAVTGYGQDADRQRAHAAGFHDHLVKPVDLDKMAQLLASELPTGSGLTD